MKSKYLKEFIEEIKYKNRNPRDLKALELLNDIPTNPQIVIGTSESLYRARVVNDDKEIGKEKDFYGYDAKGSLVPPANLTRDFRANYRYIPYLYCANHPYVALAEVRPRLGTTVSIATIAVREPLRLLDFTIQHKPSKMSDAKKNLFEDLSALFSMPVTSNDDIIDYIPTQFVAEYAKYMGYDGIAFSSSVTPEFYLYDPNRFNVVVFNYDKCVAIKSNVVMVTRTYIESEQFDADPNELKINNYIEDELDKLHEYQQTLINA